MESASSSTKKRSAYARSKTGCVTCKLRRVKCDEEKPFCAKCTRSGWKCDGYRNKESSSKSPAVVPIEPRDGHLPKFILGSPIEDESKREAREAELLQASLMNNQGCAPCRLRSIPCDEVKPACRNCLQSDRECVGYKMALPRRASQLTLLAPPSPSPIRGGSMSPTATSIPFQMDVNASELELLHYFCVKAAPDLCGFSNANFWHNLILPSSHYDPAVRHAVLALSAFHREFIEEGSIQSSANSQALQQYNKALRKLQYYLADKEIPSKKTVLICCILFYCVEIARENYEIALRHLKSGLVILQEWKEKTDNLSSSSNMDADDQSDINELLEVFAKLDVQVRIFDHGNPPYLMLTTPEERSGQVPPIPTKFYTLADAWKTLDKLTNWVMHFMSAKVVHEQDGTLPPEMLHEKMILTEELDRWTSTFNSFIEKNKKHFDTTKADKDSAMMVELLFQGMRVLFHMSVSVDGIPAIDTATHLHDILNLAETIISRRSLEANQAPRSFSFETGLVSCLWLVATHSDDMEMSDRAVALLKIWPIREGVWDGIKVADIIERGRKGVGSMGSPMGRSRHRSQHQHQHSSSSQSQSQRSNSSDRGKSVELFHSPTQLSPEALGNQEMEELEQDLHSCLLDNPWRKA